jgi:hypothetical protein
MRFIKITLLFMFLLTLPIIYGGNINGWGSQYFFSGNQINEGFDTGYNNSFLFNRSSTINIGSNTKTPVSCDLNSYYSGNELVLYSGNTIYIYTGNGNTITLIDTFSTEYVINDVGCINDDLWAVTNGEIYNFYYDYTNNIRGNLVYNLDTDYGGYQVRCNYYTNKCFINYGFGMVTASDKFDSLTTTAYEYDGFTIDLTDDFQIYDNTNIYLIKANFTTYYVDLTTGQRTLFGGFVSGVTPSLSHYKIGDLNNDNKPEFCSLSKYAGLSNPPIICNNKDGFLFSKTLSPGAGSESYGLYGLDILDFNNDGQNDVCVSLPGTQAPFHRSICYNPITEATTHETGGASGTISTILWTGSQNNQYLSFYRGAQDLNFIYSKTYGSTTQFFNTYSSSTTITLYTTLLDTRPPQHVITDLTGDGNLEFITSKSGETIVYFKNAINEYAVPPSITFSGNTLSGGFFGYYIGNTCPETFVTFQAQQCVGDIKNCNYYNQNTEKERLYIDCGNGQFITGSYSNTNPSATCYYNATNPADYETVIYIQSESLPDSLRVNNLNVPIQITVRNTTTCNGAFYTQPVLNGSSIDSGDVQPPTEPIETPTEEDLINSVSSGIPLIFTGIQSNIKLIMALVVILGVVGTLAGQGIRNPIILLFGAIVGLVLTASLGLVSTGYIVLMVVIIISLFLLSMTIFKTAEV